MEVPPTVADAIAFGSAALPLGARAVAVSRQVDAVPTALTFGQYAPGLVLLALGPAVGVWLRRRHRPPAPQPLLSAAA
ncbi:hypothetical protein [Streptacidiphilus jiangxiensis]|uniref:Uncharacterized protein n=1 Tax=Streptacidiphilus jiangxiensis TaxID=235985 RepID=A0A1H7SQ99_STRJI|nr:hypothetical protein [Streptacidiphilus jiangxiensis]SEL74771.1 hypothetical protein SAMN05414137_112157 [Streptacidiphilus jiangxiensis]